MLICLVSDVYLPELVMYFSVYGYKNHTETKELNQTKEYGNKFVDNRVHMRSVY